MSISSATSTKPKSVTGSSVEPDIAASSIQMERTQSKRDLFGSKFYCKSDEQSLFADHENIISSDRNFDRINEVKESPSSTICDAVPLSHSRDRILHKSTKSVAIKGKCDKDSHLIAGLGERLKQSTQFTAETKSNHKQSQPNGAIFHQYKRNKSTRNKSGQHNESLLSGTSSPESEEPEEECDDKGKTYILINIYFSFF